MSNASKLFVPKEFEVPTDTSMELATGDGMRLVPLEPKYVLTDTRAVNGSRTLILQTRGGTWPSRRVTLVENDIDLREHRRQFLSRESFAYALFFGGAVGSRECGCLYIYPSDSDLNDAPSTRSDTEVVVNFWLSKSFFTPQRYDEFYGFVVQWLAQDWPWTSQIEITNVMKPGDPFLTLNHFAF